MYILNLHVWECHIESVAYAGFILAGAENEFRGGRKKIRGGIIAREGREQNSAPLDNNIDNWANPN